MTLSQEEALRYDGVRYRESSRGHVESYFVKLNDPSQTRALWIRTTIFARRGGDGALAEAWAIAFDRERGNLAVKATFPLRDARFSRDAIDVALPGVTLTRKRAAGSVRHDAQAIEFDLALSDETAPQTYYPAAWMYEGSFPSSKILSPMPDLRATGHVVVGGDRWDVRGWRGLLGHNWGKQNAFAYAWGHCNVWDEADDVVFEGTSGRVRVGPILIPTTTTLVFRCGETAFALNGPGPLLTNRASITFRSWKFSGHGPNVSVRGEFSSQAGDMVGLHYPNPDGTMTYCLNSKLASAEIEIRERGGSPRVLHSRAAALEIGTRKPDHGIPMVL